MSYQPIATSPNVDKLFNYLQKCQWHNVSANFSGFVRKEFESNLDKLEEDVEVYRNLKLMVEYSEMGRFSEARNIIDPAYKEYQEMMNKLTEMKRMKISPRRHPAEKAFQSTENYQRRDTYTPDKRDIASRQKRNIYTPNQQQPRRQDNSEFQRQATPQRNPVNESATQHQSSENYQRRDAYTPDKRNIASPQKRNIYTPNQQQTRPQDNREYHRLTTPQGGSAIESSKRHHEVSDRGLRTPQYPQMQEQATYDPHMENYDSLRLKSPEKPPSLFLQEHQNKDDTQRNMTPVDHGSRPNSHRQDRRSPAPAGVLTSAAQMTSNKALWGRDHGDKTSEKIAFSTYKNDFPSYTVDSHERKDKEAYRQNFGSLAERGTYRGGDDSYYQEEQKRTARHSETPDYDNRPSELARRFKDLHTNEWTDAYDEICKDFGSEKTVRHLLWIATEASLIANDVADHQLRDLEKQTFGVMTHPGNDHEAWLIAIDVADTQLKDLEKAALGLMAIPGHEYHGGFVPRNLGDTLPASKNLLLKYRKQTGLLSIPYVKEECRDKISRTLIESSGFQKQYLSDASRLTAYIYKCAELVWLMCVQDPPIVLEYITKETEGARFNHEHYHAYTKSGTTYDFGVWPMLRIGKKGQILAKGIAQGI